MSAPGGRRGVPWGRVAGLAGTVVAAGMLASCGGPATGTGAGPGPAGAATAGPCAMSRASAGSGGPRMPMLPPPGSTVVSYQLNGVAVVSAASVWAIGTTDLTDPRAMHWNGSKWSEQVLTLTPG